MLTKIELNAIRNTIRDEIEKINKLNKHFKENELAYLALTSKIELPIRDKFAFRLHTELSPQGLLISREWERSDIAIIKNGKPIALFEFKAMYTFDGTKDVNGFPNLMIKDVKKIQKMATSDTKLYSILLATHPLKEIDESLSGVVKYANGVNKAFSRYKTAEKILETCNSNIEGFFGSKTIKVTRGNINAGECFGIKVKIPFWIIGPFNKNYKFS